MRRLSENVAIPVFGAADARIGLSLAVVQPVFVNAHGQRRDSNMARGWMVGAHVFVACADPRAGEVGVVYQAVGRLFCGFTSPTEKFGRPDDKIYDARNVHLLTGDRRFGKLRYKRHRAEQKQLLISEGCQFFKDDQRKLRYVSTCSARRTTLSCSLQSRTQSGGCPARTYRRSPHRPHRPAPRPGWTSRLPRQ
jgi:hypothetical protein